MPNDVLEIGGTKIPPRSRTTLNLPVAPLYTGTNLCVPVHVVRGRPGPHTLFVSAALHGDEIVGTEIIRRLLQVKGLGRLRGTLIAVPVVNVYGYTGRSRYLPDRRDLNRFFPGSSSGSMASRLAHLFMNEIVLNSTHGLDLHTGAVQRTNLPQIRGRIDHEPSMHLARAFGAPVILNAGLRDGSLREAASEAGIPVVVYEAGEALRLDEPAVRVGLRGVLNVMRKLEMLPGRRSATAFRSVVAAASHWVRAPESGTVVAGVSLGDSVSRGQVIARIVDPLGETSAPVESRVSGVVIGKTTLPLAYEGEALFNVAAFDEDAEAARRLEAYHASLDA